MIFGDQESVRQAVFFRLFEFRRDHEGRRQDHAVIFAEEFRHFLNDQTADAAGADEIFFTVFLLKDHMSDEKPFFDVFRKDVRSGFRDDLIDALSVIFRTERMIRKIGRIGNGFGAGYRQIGRIDGSEEFPVKGDLIDGHAGAAAFVDRIRKDFQDLFPVVFFCLSVRPVFFLFVFFHSVFFHSVFFHSVFFHSVFFHPAFFRETDLSDVKQLSAGNIAVER